MNLKIRLIEQNDGDLWQNWMKYIELFHLLKAEDHSLREPLFKMRGQNLSVVLIPTSLQCLRHLANRS